MKRLEAICDAVAACNHYWEPESESYEIRNPGMLPDDAGKRVFSCHRAGYAALLDRVQKYCVAHPDADVLALLSHFGIRMKKQQEEAVDFMARCASSNALTLSTSLHWFVEETHGHITASHTR